jgi:arabinose-5-phosphate isomerase
MEKEDFKLDLFVLEDTINCLNDIINNPKNIKQLEDLSLILKPFFIEELPIYLTGIGKPGYVAQKQAASLKSIRINAQFIDAILAGHGDIGPIPIEKESILIALSKSGCSTELYTLFEILKQKRPNCKVVLICMSNSKQLDTICKRKDIDFIAHFDVNPKELDGYGIIPSTSNVLFEVILSTVFSNVIKNTFGFYDMCKRLQESHPSGSLYDKVTNLLENFNK